MSAELPVCEVIGNSNDPSQLWVRAFGSRRGNTLKNHAMVWGRFTSWLRVTKGRDWPSSAADLLQYLDERNEVQGLPKTFPNSLHGALILLETVGQVGSENKISEDSLCCEAVRSWTAELEADAPPRRQAQMYSVAVLIACELVVDDENLLPGFRFYAFMLLLMFWGTLRCDDLQNIDPRSCLLSQWGLRFIIKWTKTTGPGKSVGALHGFISRSVSLSGADWLRAGLDLCETDELNFPRDFYAIELTVMNIGMLLVNVLLMLKVLHVESGQCLVS